MLHIILVILKIIGIILVLCFALLLTAVLLLLFVPFRYRLAGEKNADGIGGQGQVSWLLHLITVTGEYKDGTPVVYLRIFVFRKSLYPAVVRPPKKKWLRRGKKKIPQREHKKAVVQTESPEFLPLPKPSPVKSASHPETVEPRAEAPKSKWNIKTLLKSVIAAIKNFWQKLKKTWEKIKAIGKRMVDLKDRLANLLALLREDATRQVLKRFMKHLRYLWRHLRPRKVKGNVHFGFEDPAMTGQVAGVIYLLLPMNCYKVRLRPDFENTVCEGSLTIKGYIRSYHLAIIGWKVFRDKEFRNLLTRIKA